MITINFKTATLLLLWSMLSACAKGSDSSGSDNVNLKQTCERDSIYAGEWRDEDLYRLDLGDDCYGLEYRCQASFRYYKPVNGKVTIEVSSALNHPGCLTVGEHVCNITHDHLNNGTEYLAINCGGTDTFYFPRQ